MAKLFGKSLKAYEDINIDELLETLTEEELEELGQELIDPDDSCIPPSDRCRYKTTKAPTGPFNRKALLDFIEKRAREEKDWDEPKPFRKEVRGKIFKPKEPSKAGQINDDVELDTEWDEVLATATEEELVDLAAILGFHGMLNQVQYHQAFVENKDQGDVGGGFQGVAKPENFKLFEDEAPNATDVDACLKQIKANDPELKDLNLNNLKNISIERLVQFGEALASNTNLEQIHLSNTKATDKVAKAFAKSLESNKTLRCLDMESNYISGNGIVQVMEAINVNKTLTEFRIANQRPRVLGNRIEMRIAQLCKENVNLLKFGIFMESPARVLVHEFMKRNNDNLRRGRIGEDLIEAPKPKENKYARKPGDPIKPAKAAVVEAEKQPEPKVEEEEEESEEEDSDEDETESSEEEEE